MVSMFKIDIIKSATMKGMRNTKLSVFDVAASRWGDMMYCANCNDTWNNHAGIPTSKVPAGMCLTQENFDKTGTCMI